MKKIIFLLPVILVLAGCVRTHIDQPPPISDESVLYQNEYFSISYPKGWIVEENYPDSYSSLDSRGRTYKEMGKQIDVTKTSFKCPGYVDYLINVNVEKLDEVVKSESSYSVTGFDSIQIGRFKSEGYGHLSQSAKSVLIRGLHGQALALKMKKNSGRFEIVNVISLNDGKYLYSITYKTLDCFPEEVIRRIESVVNSFLSRSSPKGE